MERENDNEQVAAEEEEEDGGGAWVLSDDDLSWSGELLLSNRRLPHLQLEDVDDDDDDQVAWDQLELDPDPAPGQCPSTSISHVRGATEDNDGPSASSSSTSTSTSASSSPPQPPAERAEAGGGGGGCRHDQDEHSRWLRETNAFLQEAMVYLVGSIALKTQKDERRALQCFRKAHELGHARGTFRVGLAHLEGTGGVEKGEELAKAYLRESLNQFVSHQIQDSDYYGNFRQYLENDFRHGALRHPLVLDLLQLYAEQSEDIKKVVDFALERNGARRRNITIAGNLPIFETAATVAAADVHEHQAVLLAGGQPIAGDTLPTRVEEAERTEGKESTEAEEMSKRRAKEKARRERNDKKTAAAADKKEKKRLVREDKAREKERRREEKRARKIEKEAAKRTKEEDRKVLKKQPSSRDANRQLLSSLSSCSASTT